MSTSCWLVMSGFKRVDEDDGKRTEDDQQMHGHTQSIDLGSPQAHVGRRWVVFIKPTRAMRASRPGCRFIVHIPGPAFLSRSARSARLEGGAPSIPVRQPVAVSAAGSISLGTRSVMLPER
jgi:hypothetical protein